MVLRTQFAPAERKGLGVISNQASSFLRDQQLTLVLDAIITPVLILNDHRQIVHANKSFLDFTGITDLKLILGMRPGEAIGCIHANENEAGCGTTTFCRHCGGVRAILSSIKGNVDVQECSISLDEGSRSLDFRIMAVPLEQYGERFTVFSITDIADEKRKEILERIFLHDVSNTAGGIHGLIRLLFTDRGEKTELYKSLIYDLSDRLLEEIKAHRQLLEAENKTLEVVVSELNTLEFLERIKNTYTHHDVARDNKIVIDPKADNIAFTSDENILARVVSNMTKNALEATEPGNPVTLSCKKRDETVVFTVHNKGFIAPDAQLQIFKRSFSTKGTGRGLGTYSIKLLSEQYLSGKVGFTSSEQAGTQFHAEYPLRQKS